MIYKHDIEGLPVIVENKANEANFITVNNEGRYVVTIDDYSYRNDPGHWIRSVEMLDLRNASYIASLFGGKNEKDVTNPDHVFGRGASYIRFSFDDKLTAARYLDVALDYKKYLKVMLDSMFNGGRLDKEASLFMKDLMYIYLNEDATNTKFLRDPLRRFGYTKEDIIERGPDKLKNLLSALTKRIMIERLRPTLADCYVRPMQVSFPRPVDIGVDELGLRSYKLIGIRTFNSNVIKDGVISRPLVVDHNGNERCDTYVGPTADQLLDIYDSLSEDEKMDMHYFMSGHDLELNIKEAVKGLTTDSTCKGLTYKQQRMFIDYAYNKVGSDSNEQRKFLEQVFDKTIRELQREGANMYSGWIETARKEIADLSIESNRQLCANENKGLGIR